MNQKEIAEIKKNFSMKRNTIQDLDCCYINEDRAIIATTSDPFQSLPEEEMEKYLGIFSKALSGKMEKNLTTLEFPLDAEKEEGMQNILYTFQKEKKNPDEIFQKIIETYTNVGPYVILIGSGVYDIPAKASDASVLEDSDEAYKYMICCICPVTLTEEGLVYSEEDTSFKAMSRKYKIRCPQNAFLFPAFNDRSTDIHSILYYSKKEIHAEFITNGLNCNLPLLEGDQKEYFTEAIKKAFPTDYTLERATELYQNLQEAIYEGKDEISKKELSNIFESCGAKKENLDTFEESLPEGVDFHLKNIIDENKYIITGKGISIKVDADQVPLIEAKVIDGQSYLCIPVSAGLEKDGVCIK